MSVDLVDVSRFYGSTLSNKKERSEVTDSNISPKKVSDMRKRSEVTARVWIGPGFPKKMSEKRKRSEVTDSHISSKKVSDKEKKSEVTESHTSSMKVKVRVCHLISLQRCWCMFEFTTSKTQNFATVG